MGMRAGLGMERASKEENGVELRGMSMLAMLMLDFGEARRKAASMSEEEEPPLRSFCFSRLRRPNLKSGGGGRCREAQRDWPSFSDDSLGVVDGDGGVSVGGVAEVVADGRSALFEVLLVKVRWAWMLEHVLMAECVHRV